MSGFDKVISPRCGAEVGLVLIGNALKRLWPEYKPKRNGMGVRISRRMT